MTDNAEDDVGLQLYDLIMGMENVEDFLDQLAKFSAATLSYAAGADIECSVTLQRRRKTTTVAGSSPQTIMLDRLEHRLGNGPRMEALRSMSMALLADVGADSRWPAYQAQAAALGCHSVLGVPLEIGEGSTAALNFYAPGTGIFTVGIITEASEFADLAGRSLRLALRIGTAQSRAEDLTAALERRTTIDLACGVVMAQNRCTQEEAIGVLTRVSNNRNQKLRDVAAEILRNITTQDVRTHFDA